MLAKVRTTENIPKPLWSEQARGTQEPQAGQEVEYTSSLTLPLLSVKSLCDPRDYSLPGSSVHGILQARIEYWSGVAIPFSRGSSQPRDRIWVSCIAGRFFTVCATREVPRTLECPSEKNQTMLMAVPDHRKQLICFDEMMLSYITSLRPVVRVKCISVDI